MLGKLMQTLRLDVAQKLPEAILQWWPTAADFCQRSGTKNGEIATLRAKIGDMLPIGDSPSFSGFPEGRAQRNFQ